MKRLFLQFTICLLGIFLGLFLYSTVFDPEPDRSELESGEEAQDPQYDSTAENAWNPEFSIVEIESSLDGMPGKAYFYSSKSVNPAPLVVSLHTWSGDYTQEDPLAELCRKADVNYIHPDFRGPNWTVGACCSPLALGDIDDAIDFALGNSNVDTSNINVIGVSGGGYATLAMFIKSRHQIRRYSAWVPISDLVAWFEESKIRGNKYAGDILACTGSKDGELELEEAKRRSPLHWKTPPGRLDNSELIIYAGVYDGIQGSVPITQSINFYNKVLSELYPGSEATVSLEEKARLLEFRKPLGAFGAIGGREICLEKSSGNLRLVIFTGNHEMLPEAAFDNLR